MKYVNIYPSDTLSDLTERIGVRNIDQVLADNGLTRTPRVGQQWVENCNKIKNSVPDVDSQRKISILNQFVGNSDIYETAALADSNDWKLLSHVNAFSNYLYISDQLEDSIPDSYQVLGNKISVSSETIEAVNASLQETGMVDSIIFSTYSTIRDAGIVQGGSSAVLASNPLDWFNIPNGSVTLYSSLSGTSINIPAFPEEINDTRAADYTTMPDLLYQYEPWQMYQNSGPRTNTYTFNLHRDMWTGNHNDGKANELVRFCQAQCYPRFAGSAVQVPKVSLYISGANVITGTVGNVDVNWNGPLGDDGWYLAFTLSITITEVSPAALNHDVILQKPLIG